MAQDIHHSDTDFVGEQPMLSEAGSVDEQHMHNETTRRGQKRTIDDHVEDEVDYAAGLVEDESTRKKRKKAQPPPKKLNNEQWDMMFDRLVAFKTRYGHTLVPKRYEHDKALGTWVETQRQVHRKLVRMTDEDGEGETVVPNKRLNPERLERLKSIGFVWSARSAKKNQFPVACPADSSPSGMQPRVKKVPTADEMAARTASRQRQNDANWQDMFSRLASYKEKHGDCLVPKKFEEDPKLGNWVEAQRVLFNRGSRSGKPKAASRGGSATEQDSTEAVVVPGKTPEEWATEMDEGNTATAEDAAEIAATMAEAALEVVDELTPAHETTSDVARISEAGDMVEEAIDESSEAAPPTKRLTNERKTKLDDLGFVWSLRSKRVDDHWDEMFKLLLEYKEKHGDCLVPSRYEENPKLGKWIETQRYEMTKLQRAADGTEKPEATKEGAKNRANNARLTDERQRRLEAIGFEWKVKNKMRRYYDRQWETMFEKLVQFKNAYGHCMVPKRYPEDQKLGTWVHTQRIQYRKTQTGARKEGSEDNADEESAAIRLTDDRFNRLQEIGFVWSAREIEKKIEAKGKSSYDEQWDAMFERLRAYKETHGHCLVPKRCPEDPKLGTWVDTQRVSMKKMRKQLAAASSRVASVNPDPNDVANLISDVGDEAKSKPIGRLTQERISKLESLGFVWSLRDDWFKHYSELVEYKRQHGQCNVPARYAANRKLGIWTSAQRQQYKLLSSNDPAKRRRAAPLTPDRIALLNQLGFTWTIRSRDSLGESWNQRLQDLKEYKNQHGNTLVPSRYPPNEALGVWVGTQRTQYRLYMKAKEGGENDASVSSAMTEDRMRQLEDLGFVWTLRGGSDQGWKKRLGDLEEFRSMYGHANVPRDFPPNRSLAQWAAEMRTQLRSIREGRSSSLDEAKVAELESLGFGLEEQPHSNPAPIHDSTSAQTEHMGESVHMDLEGVDDVGDTLLHVAIEHI